MLSSVWQTSHEAVLIGRVCVFPPTFDWFLIHSGLKGNVWHSFLLLVSCFLPFPPALPLSPLFVYFPTPSHSKLWRRLPQNPACVCLTGVLSGMWNIRPCCKDADSKGSVPGAFHPGLAAGEPQGHREALCGGHGEIYRRLWLQGAVSQIRRTLTFWPSLDWSNFEKQRKQETECCRILFQMIKHCVFCIAAARTSALPCCDHWATLLKFLLCECDDPEKH